MIRFLLFFVVLAAPSVLRAESFIRDDEIEKYLISLSAPVFRAAGLESDDIKIHIINSPVLNAYVSGGQHVFINTGLILESDDPSMLTGVIAHETGHIASGHLVRQAQDLKKAGKEAMLGYILGAISVAAGAPPEAGLALASGGKHIAERKFLKYSRSNEESADHSAVKLLEKIGVSPRGLMNLLEKMSTEYTLDFGGELNPYLLTHPLSQDRVAFFRNVLLNSPELDKKIPYKLKRIHKRVLYKLRAFLDKPEKTLKFLEKKENTVAVRYGKAVAYYRGLNLDKATDVIDKLISDFPEDSYFYELKGQMLFENGRIKESVKSYEKSVALLPQSALLNLETAVAQLALGGDLIQVIARLKKVTRIEPNNIFAWRQLGIAYGKNKQIGLSYLSLAEESALLGKSDDAKKYIVLARTHLKKNSPADLRAEDLLRTL